MLQVVHGVGEKLLREMVESMEGHYLKSKGLFYLLLDSLLPQLKKDTAESAEMIRPALRYLKEPFDLRYVSSAKIEGDCLGAPSVREYSL